jgi:hypothetical protein
MSRANEPQRTERVDNQPTMTIRFGMNAYWIIFSILSRSKPHNRSEAKKIPTDAPSGFGLPLMICFVPERKD